MIVIAPKNKLAQYLPPGASPRTVEDDLVPATDHDFVSSTAPKKNVQESPEDYWIWKPDIQHTFLPEAPPPASGKIPVPPENILGEEFMAPPDPREAMSVRELVVESLNTAVPLRISYLTLDGMHGSERTVHPDYVYWSGTNRHVLVAWDELRNDWRAFAIDNIRYAKLMEEQWLE